MVKPASATSKISFSGPFGLIEGKYYKDEDPTAPVALVLPPHPAQGGTMDNVATYHLFHSFVSAGLTTLRINLPGVGGSAGGLDKGHEFYAASAALDWLENENPEASHCWIGGAYFGAWVSMHLVARRPEIEGFILIAPPVKNYDFSFAFPCSSAGLIVHGDEDDVIKSADVSKAVETWRQQSARTLECELLTEADHFFTDKLDLLRQVCTDYINTQLATRIAKPVRKKRRRRKRRSEDDDSVSRR